MKNFLMLTLISFVLSGCGMLSPTIQEFQDTGFTRSGREQALNTELKDYHHALFWGQINQALGYVDEKSVPSMRNQFRKMSKDGRIVESKVEFVDFDEEARSAEVEVSTRFHRNDTNIVENRTTYEQWQFSLTDGWKLSETTKKSLKVDMG